MSVLQDTRFRKSVRDTGFSLIELLVSLFLGVLLSTAMVSAYLGSKRSYYHNEQMSRLQENGRYALRILSRDLAMAGFYGGSLEMHTVPVPVIAGDCANQPWALDAANSLDTVDNYHAGTGPVALSTNVLTCIDAAAVADSTDILVIKRTAAEPSLRDGVISPAVLASNVDRWYLRLGEGLVSRWQKVQSRDFTSSGSSLSGSYWQAVTRIFFIRKYAQTRGDELPSLCMETLAGNGITARCLVEGVENMQLQFGIDLNGDGITDIYMARPSYQELQLAVTVKVYLLLRSVDPLPGYSNHASYRLGDDLVRSAGDAYVRQVFSATIELGSRARSVGQSYAQS